MLWVSLNYSSKNLLRLFCKSIVFSCWSAKKPKKKSARLVAGITGSERTPYRRNVTSATLGSSGALGSGATSASSSRNARPNYRNLFMSTVPFIPPSQVPEDLIVQVQNVLQGKSRSLIIRELQRTVRSLGKI